MIQSVDKTAEKAEYERLRAIVERQTQALLSFTGVLRQSSDPSVREAAQLLYKQVKAKP